MPAWAKLIRVDAAVEEEVVLSFGEMELTCFAAYAPDALHAGRVYLVEMSLFFVDGADLNARQEGKLEIRRMGSSFKYEISGLLHKDKLITRGFVFQDDCFLSEYARLENRFVSLVVDRMDVAFLEVAPDRA